MSRIRSIKPEFWTSEQVLKCSTNARLLFLGLWNFCDDFGRHPHSAKQCKAEVFPADDFTEKDILGMLAELSGNGLIKVYTTRAKRRRNRNAKCVIHDGKEYFYVTGWKHQRIDKPQPAKYPDPFADHSTNVPRVIPPDRKGEDKRGEEGKGSVGRSPRATRPDHPQFEAFKKAYPKRKGANPWTPASSLFSAAIAAGATAEQIIGALKAGVGFDRDKIGTEFIPRAMQWLNERRYADHDPTPIPIVVSGVYVAADTPQMDAWLVFERGGKRYPRDRTGGWHFPSEWPPGHESEAA